MSDFIKYEVKVYPNGEKHWYLNGERHNEHGPAIEYANGTKYWYLNGKLHRVDGPAVEYADGERSWYLDDVYYTESEYKTEVARRHNEFYTCDGKTVVIDGKEYTLHEVKK